MNKKITGVVLAIVVFGVLIWLARPKTENNPTPPTTINAEENLDVQGVRTYDFGKVSMANGDVKHTFAMQNNTDRSINIQEIYTSCMCTTALLMTNGKAFGPYGMPGHGLSAKINQTIQPQEEFTIETTFDPAAHGPAGIGKVTRSIIIERDGGEKIELLFNATVTP